MIGPEAFGAPGWTATVRVIRCARSDRAPIGRVRLVGAVLAENGAALGTLDAPIRLEGLIWPDGAATEPR